MKDIQKLRTKIDKIDQELLSLIEKRVDLVREIGKIKKELDLPVKDNMRENIIIEQLIEKIENSQIDPKAIEQIWKTIFATSYKIEE
ncbi:MAG TPA: chorismate mutase [Patescibacteria group bacterium]|nr:chorismate mutase [Patescibacteria group bacterium]